MSYSSPGPGEQVDDDPQVMFVTGSSCPSTINYAPVCQEEDSKENGDHISIEMGEITGSPRSLQEHDLPVNGSVEDIEKLLVEATNAPFSFREGFYHHSDVDLDRQYSRTYSDLQDLQDRHHVEDITPVRPLLALQSSKHRHHHKHRRHHRPKTPTNKEDVTASESGSTVGLPSGCSISTASPEIIIMAPSAHSPDRGVDVVEGNQSPSAASTADVQFYVGATESGDIPIEVTTPPVAPVLLRVRSQPGSGQPSPKQHVKFQLGSTEGINEDLPTVKTDSQTHLTVSSPRKQHHRHHHHHHHHGSGGHVPTLEELANRRHRGSEVRLRHQPSEPGNLSGEVLRFDDDEKLPAVDLDDIASHRFSDQKGIRRRKFHQKVHSAMASIVQISQPQSGGSSRNQTAFDHTSHEMFVELDELHAHSELDLEWREKARWIKFEEDVEEGADRFGKPHVASLSFHSLINLRKVLAKGALLLDLDSSDLPTIAKLIADELKRTDQVDTAQHDKIMEVLLLKHRHVNERSSHMRRNDAVYNNLHNLESGGSSTGIKKTLSGASLRAFFSRKKKSDPNLGSQPTQLNPEENAALQPVQSNPNFKKPSILQRIPESAEVTTVLVGKVDFLDDTVMAFVRLAKGEYLGNLTEVPLPVRFLFMLMGPTNPKEDIDYHEVGRSISTLMSNTSFHDSAYRASGRKDLLDAINEFLDDSLVLPPGDYDKRTLMPVLDHAQRRTAKKRRKKAKEEAMALKKQEEELYGDPLKRTGRLFGGLVNDVRRRYPQYLSDLKDGLNVASVACFVFIYFACLSPAITFGGLLGEKTEKWMGVSETLLMTSIGGIIFSLFSCQPLCILGMTGPILIFEEALYQISERHLGIEYMVFRFWVGVWVTIMSIIMVAIEGSFLVRLFTRFTEEIFASLISLIFIYEVFFKLYTIFMRHPLMEYYPLALPEAMAVTNLTVDSRLNDLLQLEPNLRISALDYLSLNNSMLDANNSMSNSTLGFGYRQEPNTALLSLILTSGTFLIAYFLKGFRNSKFLGRRIRMTLGDFGVPISIFLMVLVDYLVKEAYTDKLDVPDGLKPTAGTSTRGWFINPLGMETTFPVWAMFAAIIPAMLVFILIFMESQITAMIVNKKDRKLKKGSGYHMDLLIVGCLASVSGIMGLPIVVIATVRSVTHVSSLTIYSKTHAPGEKPKLVEVKEQRVTALAVHIMIGLSVLCGPVLRLVPLAVLFGVFFYMGIASMSGIQFFERFRCLFMPVKHHPDVGYVRRVRTGKMHLFTGIQMVCLIALWVVKSTVAALAFPFVLILMVPFRKYLLKHVFTQNELQELDAENAAEEDDDDDGDEQDFYTQAHMPM